MCPSVQDGPEQDAPGSSQETEPMADDAGEAMEEEQGQPAAAGVQSVAAEDLAVVTRGELPAVR